MLSTLVESEKQLMWAHDLSDCTIPHGEANSSDLWATTNLLAAIVILICSIHCSGFATQFRWRSSTARRAKRNELCWRSHDFAGKVQTPDLLSPFSKVSRLGRDHCVETKAINTRETVTDDVNFRTAS